MQDKADRDLEREVDELMQAGAIAWKLGKSTEICPYPKDSWEGGVWIDGFIGAPWDVMARAAYFKGFAAGLHNLATAPPGEYLERADSRLVEAWLDGLFNGSCCFGEPASV